MHLDKNNYEVIVDFDMLSYADHVLCMAYDDNNNNKHSTLDLAKKGIQLARKNGFDHKKYVLGYNNNTRLFFEKSY